jgi:hypothetical protein
VLEINGSLARLKLGGVLAVVLDGATCPRIEGESPRAQPGGAHVVDLFHNQSLSSAEPDPGDGGEFHGALGAAAARDGAAAGAMLASLVQCAKLEVLLLNKTRSTAPTAVHGKRAVDLFGGGGGGSGSGGSPLSLVASDGVKAIHAIMRSSDKFGLAVFGNNSKVLHCPMPAGEVDWSRDVRTIHSRQRKRSPYALRCCCGKGG